VLVGCSLLLVPFLGRDFFPTVDPGRSACTCARRWAPVSRIPPPCSTGWRPHPQGSAPGEITSVVDNIGMPVSGINLAYSNTGGIGPQDGDILVTLKEDHRPTADHVRLLREKLPRAFPGSSFSFLPADIVSQILNFGAPPRST
jgi:hypothetical protein